MNGTFQNMVLKNASGLFKQVRANSSSLSATLLTTINRIKGYLEDSVSKAENFIPAFVSDPEAVADKAAESIILEDSIITRIDTDTATLMFNSVSETGEDGQLVLTDNAGRPYYLRTIKDWEDQPLMIATSELAKYSDDIDGFAEALVMKEHVSPMQNSIQFKLTALCNKFDIPHDTMHGAVLALVRHYCGTHTPVITPPDDVTIYDGLRLAARLAYGETDEVPIEKLLWLEDGVWYLQNIWPTTDGLRTFYLNVISSLVENDAVNTCLLKFCRLATSGQAAPVSILAAVSDMANSRYASVREVCSNLTSAVASSGLSGLCQAIIGYFKALTTMNGDNGYFEFTDNSSFVPTVYVSGIISAVFNVVSALATIIATIIGRVLGVIVAVISAIGQQVFNAITTDATATRAGIVESDANQLDMAPFAIVQFERSAADFPMIVSLLTSGYPIVAMQILGGWVLFGIGSSDSNGTITTIRMEVHPDTDGHLRAYNWFKNNVVFPTIEYYTQQGEIRSYYRGNITVSDLDYWMFETAAEEEERFDPTQPLYNQEDGRLSEDDDFDLCRRVCRSTALCLLYMQLLAGNPSGANAIVGPIQGEPVYYYVSNGGDHMVTQSIRTLGWFSWAFPMLDEIQFNMRGHHWEWMAKCTILSANAWMFGLFKNQHSYSVAYAFDQKRFFGEPLQLAGSIEYTMVAPKYSAASFWAIVALTAILSTVAVVGTIVVASAIKRAIRKKQAISAAKVYAAADDLQHNPDAAHYAVYKRAVTKNNILATLTGGTKYDRVNVWNAGSAAASGAVSSPLLTSVIEKNPFLNKEPEQPVIPEYPDPEQAVAAGIYQLSQQLTSVSASLSSQNDTVLREVQDGDQNSADRANAIARLISGRNL